MRHSLTKYWAELTLTVLVATVDAQWEGMGDVHVGSARYEPALLPPCPTIRVLSYSNLSIFRNSALQGLMLFDDAFKKFISMSHEQHPPTVGWSWVYRVIFHVYNCAVKKAIILYLLPRLPKLPRPFAAILLYCCPGCPANAIQMGQAIWATCAAVKKCVLNSVSSATWAIWAAIKKYVLSEVYVYIRYPRRWRVLHSRIHLLINRARRS